MPELDMADCTPEERTRLIYAGVTPRPIAWISTVGSNRVDNLAPFSSYNYVATKQPAVLFNTPAESTGRMKDTARNALDSGEFAVNVVTEEHVVAMDSTSERLPPDESEFDHVDVERGECRVIDAPRVADAAMTMECSLYDFHEIHEQLMIIGDVQYVHLDDAVTTDGEVDAKKLKTIGRLGGPHYTVADPMPFERQF